MAGQRGINKRNGADGKCRSDLTVSKMIPVIMLKVPKSSQPSLWRNKTGRRSSATLKRAAPLDFPVSCTATTTCISHIRRTPENTKNLKRSRLQAIKGQSKVKAGLPRSRAYRISLPFGHPWNPRACPARLPPRERRGNPPLSGFAQVFRKNQKGPKSSRTFVRLVRTTASNYPHPSHHASR